MPENGRYNVFRGKKEPNKVPLSSLYMKIHEERFDQSF